MQSFGANVGMFSRLGTFTLVRMNAPGTAVLDNVFLDHPRTVDESYTEHAAFAGRFAGRLLLAAGAAAVHAVVPCLFEKTASRMVAELCEQTSNRGREASVAPIADAA